MHPVAILAALWTAAAGQPAPPPKPAPAPARPRLSQTAQRNENVAVWLIDTNAIKEANIRLGATATVVNEPLADAQYYASEFGRPASERLLPSASASVPGWHGELFANRQDALFNARAFFQVGGVKPSHRNYYGGRFTALVPKAGFLTLTFGQRQVRGMVNGNILVPLPSERVPATADPAARALIQRFLAAYPDQLPNRTDFDPRMLNTNASQRIDEINPTARLDRDAAGGRLTLSYSLQRQRIDAFQLLAGMNPDMALHDHRARLAWTRSLTPASQLSLAASFSRNHSVLAPEPNAVGPRVRFGFQIEELGPESQFPTDRATNTFRYGAAFSHRRGAHDFSAGADLTRLQLNGIESINQRGYFQFQSGNGRTPVENLLIGAPTFYEVVVGDLSRGYRNWTVNAYAADRWKIHPRLQIYYGLRYTADSAPVELNGREKVPYDCDCNNLSPRLSLAWQAGRGWVARAMYTATFGQILPVTYSQIRNNPPGAKYIIVQNPDLVDPLRGIDLDSPTLRVAPIFISPDLATPYAHLYSATLEHRLAWGSTLRTSYLGSRAIKMLGAYIGNRAVPVDGVPFTIATVNQRRPDPRYLEVRHIMNTGMAWFDAGQAAWDLPLRRGLALQAVYTFSKALDQGPDFTSTGANKDMLNNRSQSQFDLLKDRKGPSNHHSPHAFGLTYSWEIPGSRGWMLGGAHLWKKGTPLTLYVGSDSPGFGNVDGSGSDRPNILDPSILGMTIGDPNTSSQILTRSRFSYLVPGQMAGSLGRGTFSKSPIANWNASLSRQWRLPSETAVVFRIEAFNFSNTPQFDEPQRNLASPSFGRITNTLNDGRVFQISLRLVH